MNVMIYIFSYGHLSLSLYDVRQKINKNLLSAAFVAKLAKTKKK